MKARNDVIDTRNYAIGGLVEFKMIEPFSDIAAKFADEPKEPLIYSKTLCYGNIEIKATENQLDDMFKISIKSLRPHYPFKKYVNNMVYFMFSSCPNERMKHLALHSKKWRVRKKQWSRLKKQQERARNER